MLVSFSMIPLDKGAHFSKYVADSLKIVKDSGLPYELNAMSTIIEGDWDEVFGVIKQCRDQLRQESKRISIKIWVDDKVGAKGMLEGKIKSVQDKLSS
jgi:uncharacterized protein (TIGR00106 family)